MNAPVILNTRDLYLDYGGDPVCRGIELSLRAGEILGIAGASGSGKSSLLKAIIHPSAYGVHISKGAIFYRGRDISQLPPSERKKLLGREMGMIFQNPLASFNPLRKYKKQFRESLASHDLWKGEESVREILALFDSLGLGEGNLILESRPYEMSGGMNQRIALALALLLQPKLLLADEPTSALDVRSQQQVLDLFQKIRKSYKLSMILVSHDLSLLAQICDRIAVMKEGLIVEENTTEDLVLHPQSPYTRALFSALPVLGGNKL